MALKTKKHMNDRGSILIMAAVSLVAILSFAVLAIDGAMMVTTKTQLQNAADVAALAGASALVDGSQDLAVERAITFAAQNRALQVGMEPVVIEEADLSFPSPTMIRVQTHRTRATGDPLRTYFLSVVNPLTNNLTDVTASATAEAFDVCGTRCLKPWAVPDRWQDGNGNGVYDAGEVYDPTATGYNAPVDVGATITLKVGNPHQAIAPGQFFPVNYPPLNSTSGEAPRTGGDWYREFIAGCEPFQIGPGDQLQLEPGNMVGPTNQGVGDLILQDPNAHYDAATGEVKGSDFGLSPRVSLVPFFDPTMPPTSGRNYVTVVKLGAFFIESVGPGGAVYGRFIELTSTGEPCPGRGLGNSFIKGIALID
jgi:Flp pilus assembly protein TadG